MSSEDSPVRPEYPVNTDTPNGLRFAALYGDLRQLAERQLRRSAGAPISPTTLLHEAYLDMSGKDAVFPDRERFIGYAARVMRGLIIDLVRERRALKRGAAFHITQLPTELGAPDGDEAALTRLSEALDELASHDARLAEVGRLVIHQRQPLVVHQQVLRTEVAVAETDRLFGRILNQRSVRAG